MFPLLTFATGLVVGIAGVRLLKSARFDAVPTPSTDEIGKKAREGFERARSGLREAAVSGLSAVEKTSAGLREKLAPEAAAASETDATESSAEAAPETPPTAEPEAKPAPRRAPRKVTKPAEATS